MAETTLVEAFTRGGPPEPLGELLRIRPVVVDTSVLLPDVVWTTRKQGRSTFLDSIDLGLIRPFAAHHVWAEVPRKIRDDAAASGIDGDLAEAIWWGEYAPRIRFVDVSGLEVPSASQISIRDASDAPTFALAGLLAPVVALAQDRDIQDLGIATHDWIAVVRAGGELSFVARGALGGVFGANVLGYTLGAILKGIARLAKHPAGQGVLLALALYVAATHERWRPEARARLERAIRAAKGFVDASADVFDAFREVYEDASAVWRDASFDADEAGISSTGSAHPGGQPRPDEPDGDRRGLDSARERAKAADPREGPCSCPVQQPGVRQSRPPPMAARCRGAGFRVCASKDAAP